MQKLIAAFIVVCSVWVSAAGDVWYVDADTPSLPYSQDGRSWATAYDSLQEAVDDADYHYGGEVWVAEGIYTSMAMYVVELHPDVSVYAGFLGNAPGGYETARTQRDWQQHRTVLDGQNTQGCVHGANNALLDGFILRNGKGIPVPMSPLSRGGGILNDGVSPTIVNCLFVNHSARSAAAMYNSNASPIVTNCVFLANSASSSGAAMGNFGNASPVVTDCIFALNTTQYQGNSVTNVSSGTPVFRRCAFVENKCLSASGTLENLSGSPVIANCLFVHNQGYACGGVANSASSPLVINCTFANNTATLYAGAMVNDQAATPTLVNSILWDSEPAEIYDEDGSTTTATYSNIEGGWAGEGNQTPARNPHFVRGPTGTSTALAYNSDTYTSTLSHAADGSSANAFGGGVLWIATASGDIAYAIIENDDESVTVWGDITQGGTVVSPVTYATVDYHLEPDSLCVDAGRDTSAPEFGGVTDDLAGEPRGQDGLGDGPTGPPAPGDGSDYDMGAYETAAAFAPADVDHSGAVDAIDVQLVINAALGIDTGCDCDVDWNGTVDAVDVQLVINAALGIT